MTPKAPEGGGVAFGVLLDSLLLLSRQGGSSEEDWSEVEFLREEGRAEM